MLVANFVMVALMAMAPVQMDTSGHDLRFVGLAVSLHVSGMFAPAPLTGWLTDRVGALRVAPVASRLLVVAGAVSAIAGGSAVAFALGIVLLGVGWNVALVAGSSLLLSRARPAERPRVAPAPRMLT